MEGLYRDAMKIVHHYAKGCFDWLIFEQKSVNTSREEISIVSGKNKDLRLPILRVKMVSNEKATLLTFSNKLAFINHPQLSQISGI